MLLDIFPKSIQKKLEELEEQHGPAAMERIQRFLADSPAEKVGRSPAQRGKHILPGLTAKPWHDVEQYDGLREAARALEAHHPIIKEEFLARAEATGALVFYGHKKIIDGWKALYLYEDGELVKENLQYFPATIEVLRSHMRPHLYRLAEVHFSILEPETRIPPHCDQHNFTLSFHLAVSIPEGCGIRVESETRGWREGKCLLFDHSFDHEAWNESAEPRVGLIMDIWNPETTPVEREALGVIFKWMFDAFRK